jgi:hypothetical protein
MKPSYVLGLAGFLLSLVSGCDNEVETAGLLSLDFEANSFLPCGHEEAWWVLAPDELMQRYAALEIPPGQSAYATLRGERSDRGHYGHLDAYRYEFEVTEVVALRRTPPADCR